MNTELPEILLPHPHVSLYYRARVRSDSYLCCFKEIESREYVYRLTPGQKLRTIRFHGSNMEMYVSPIIVKIFSDGLLINHLLQTDNQVPVFVPYQKVLAAGGVEEWRDMYIEPCDELFEKNDLSRVLTGDVETESSLQNGALNKLCGSGIWYHNGGRSEYSYLAENLKNFVKLGQIAISELEVPNA